METARRLRIQPAHLVAGRVAKVRIRRGNAAVGLEETLLLDQRQGRRCTARGAACERAQAPCRLTKRRKVDALDDQQPAVTGPWAQQCRVGAQICRRKH